MTCMPRHFGTMLQFECRAYRTRIDEPTKICMRLITIQHFNHFVRGVDIVDWVLEIWRDHLGFPIINCKPTASKISIIHASSCWSYVSDSTESKISSVDRVLVNWLLQRRTKYPWNETRCLQCWKTCSMIILNKNELMTSPWQTPRDISNRSTPLDDSMRSIKQIDEKSDD